MILLSNNCITMSPPALRLLNFGGMRVPSSAGPTVPDSTVPVEQHKYKRQTQYTVHSTPQRVLELTYTTQLECIILRMYYGTYHKYRITQLSYYCFANARSRYSCTTRAQKQNGDIRARLGLAWLAWLALARDHSFVCSIVRIKVKTISPTLSAKFFLLTYLQRS